MDNARVTYFGSGTLNLQMIRFPSGKELVCRLDNVLGPERLKHRDSLLVVGMDGRLINVGKLVPVDAVVKAWGENKIIDDGHTGFMVVPPDHYCVQDDGPYLTLQPHIDVAALKAKIDADGPMEVRMPLTKVVPENIVTEKDVQEDDTVVLPKLITEQEVRESKVDIAGGIAADLGNKVSKQASIPPKHGSKKQRGKKARAEEGVPQDLLEAI